MKTGQETISECFYIIKFIRMCPIWGHQDSYLAEHLSLFKQDKVEKSQRSQKFPLLANRRYVSLFNTYQGWKFIFTNLLPQNRNARAISKFRFKTFQNNEDQPFIIQTLFAVQNHVINAHLLQGFCVYPKTSLRRWRSQTVQFLW